MAPSRPNKEAKPSPSTLLSDAETLHTVGKLQDAIPVAQQALELTGSGGDHELRALNLLGILHIETGDTDDARSFFARAVTLDPEGTLEEKIGGGPEKFLFLAQLSEEGGSDSVQWFEKGASALRKRIQALTDLPSRTPEQTEKLSTTQSHLGSVLCSVTEVYMTDLSWEEDAEQRCEALITEAMMIAPNSAETWQTVANVRISQERYDDARGGLRKSLELWQEKDPLDPAVPEFPERISLARLLLEVEMEEEALRVIQRLTSDDDQSVEAWYLGGWCLFIIGEKMRDGKHDARANGEADEWKSVWTSSRQWLAMCLKLYEAQEYEDERLGQHAVELFENINKELGPPKEGETDDWDDASGDDDDDDLDEEMKD
ncbi:uncharacterized protein J7T54_000072 [Emericellopsis cladophorae]|uniref:Uncharacterized protein n=1 Tax=Emericellopsis cladophorae TaxID=2686198 RepID=A0A9P9XYW1_9HYPO|nr:uncharacterized protein J7T54_000072 [Emericellopsis cladophorae]KAI6780166.1 hypothetical protein J7T54_000072 [Emericellopsis cladophorae]